MSRHTLEPRNPNNIVSVVVGWDYPMGTFFAAVEDRSGCVPVDLGDPVEQIFQPHLVLDAVRPYAAIPVDLDNQLMRDALNHARVDGHAAA